MFGGILPDDGDNGGGKKRPSGMAHPAVKSNQEEVTGTIVQPMPVVLTLGTIAKLASAILVPLLGIISTGAYFFHKTNAHIDDPVVHLARGERPRLETKLEAVKARDELEHAIKRELKVQAREIKQDVVDEQKVQIKKLGEELKAEQRVWGDRLLGELKQARKDIRSQ